MKTFPSSWVRGLLVLALAYGLAAAAEARSVRGGEPGAAPLPALCVVAGAPGAESAVLNVLSQTPREVQIEWADAAGAWRRSELRSLQAGEPAEFSLAGLARDTAVPYRVLAREAEGQVVALTGTVHTQRSPGAAFTFCVQGDSHPERAGKMFSPKLYEAALRNVVADKPDFHILLGDDFSIEHLIGSGRLGEQAVDAVYARQRGYLADVGRGASVFLVNGNHEQAARANLDGTLSNAAVLAGRARTRHFPLPAPDSFYSGDAEPVPGIGLLRDYYAWTWGDALFVVIDPYWHSATFVDNKPGERRGDRAARQGNAAPGSGEGKPGKGSGKGGGKAARDLWEITLGEAQYQWLERTLTQSKAKWKFVFCHHVLGTGRGGIECATLGEWGGRDRRGKDQFTTRRPGWSMPLQALFVKTGVSIVFQGHDHLYARQELDGVVYQTCPNPADDSFQAFNRDAYKEGEILPNSGHLRVAVTVDTVRVDYVRAWRVADETGGRRNAAVETSYTLGKRKDAQGFQTAVPERAFDVILGRPTSDSVTLSLLAGRELEARVEWRMEGGGERRHTEFRRLGAGEVMELALGGLQADTAYRYRVQTRVSGAPAIEEGAERGFHTARPSGAEFTFTLTADSHLDANTSTRLYQQTLAAARAQAPDFHIDLGDTFMTEKRREPADALPQYHAQRHYLGQVCDAAPLYLVLGNHDGEDARSGPVKPAWACTTRKRLFPNPEPNSFYSGNGVAQKEAGLLQDYYAWHWGDALFVVLDPYWFTPRARKDATGWNTTLGRVQYDWLARTLAESKARHKFVFIHNLVGGFDRQGRGGVKAAQLYEWGGSDPDGRQSFAEHRPGWPMPIHALLVRHGVTAVFHGHDHLFAKEVMDGIVYQEVPQPGVAHGSIRDAAAYGYTEGVILDGGGCLAVRVGPGAVRVQYLRADQPGRVAYEYELKR